MNSKNKKIIISIYSLSHMIVDFCCAAILYSFASKIELLTLFQLVIIYNSLAFGLQPFFGFFADKLKHPQNFSIIGCLFLLSGIFIWKNPMLTISFIGIGNALFHVGGGIISLNIERGKCTLPGIFVAPGALGLYLGTLWATKNFSNLFLAIFVVISIALIMFFEPKNENQTDFKSSANVSIYTIVILFILLSVLVRSFVGLSYNFSGKCDFTLMLIMVFAIALGKALGGVFADRWGMFNTAVVGLLMSIPLLKYGFNPYSAILGMFCFNLTMPITLTALSNIMPKYKGFAFGLTTLALLIGFLPVFWDFKVAQSMMFIEILPISVVVTAIALKFYEKYWKKS